MRQAKRTFIGFAPGQELEEFEATAYEAERVMRAVKVQLCRLDPERDPDGTLGAAVAAGGVEVTSVQFTRAELDRADVSIRGADPRSPRRWQLALERTADRWRVSAAASQ